MTFEEKLPKKGDRIWVDPLNGKLIDLGVIQKIKTLKEIQKEGGTLIMKKNVSSEIWSISTDKYANAVVRPEYLWFYKEEIK